MIEVTYYPWGGDPYVQVAVQVPVEGTSFEYVLGEYYYYPQSAKWVDLNRRRQFWMVTVSEEHPRPGQMKEWAAALCAAQEVMESIAPL